MADKIMNIDEVCTKLKEAKERRKGFKRNDETPIGILQAEFDWGYWEAVARMMKICGIKEIDAVVIQGG